MRITDRQLQFLSGTSFSTGYSFVINEDDGKLGDRLSAVNAICKGKRVVHLGCADHKDVIETKLRKGIFLHSILTRNSQKCLGIDTNREAVDILLTKWNFTNIICADITTPLREILDEHWDLLLLGEVLEHIDNPVKFLLTIRTLYVERIKRIVVTVPNALRFQNFLNAKKNIELINSDHKYWFTPFTVMKVLTVAGYRITDFQLVQSFRHRIGRKSFLKDIYSEWVLRRFPALREDIIVVADFMPAL